VFVIARASHWLLSCSGSIARHNSCPRMTQYRLISIHRYSSMQTEGSADTPNIFPPPPTSTETNPPAPATTSAAVATSETPGMDILSCAALGETQCYHLPSFGFQVGHTTHAVLDAVCRSALFSRSGYTRLCCICGDRSQRCGPDPLRGHGFLRFVMRPTQTYLF
jgi:hypothetical protein